jgi:glycosyltransferase involved in cell wall biosynthesis
MRVLVLTSSYPTPRQPAASAFLQEWTAALARRGHHLTIIAPCDQSQASATGRDGASTISYFQYLPWPGWQTLAYGGGMYDNVRSNPARLLQLPPFLHAQYREALRAAAHADVVHAHWLVPGGLVGALVKRHTGIPLVITVHSTDLHLMASLPGGRHLAKTLVRQADRVHFVSEHHRQAFWRWLGDDASVNVSSQVAPMGVADAMAYQPSRPLAHNPSVGFMGRLVPIKGVDRLLRTCASLGIERLSIAGGGPSRLDLIQLARTLGMRTSFIGVVTGRAKVRFFDQRDIMVFPSRHYASGRGEGVPVTMLEALARGRVVIASNTGGIPEVIRHGENGYLFDARSDHALKGTLQDVLASWPDARKVSGAARDTARQFTVSRLAEDHGRLYSELCGAPEASPVTA